MILGHNGIVAKILHEEFEVERNSPRLFATTAAGSQARFRSRQLGRGTEFPRF